MPTQPAPTTTGGSAIRRILVVDDNTDGADTLSLLLRLVGHEVHTRYSGRDALRAAEELRPEVVIMDLAMPDLDGYETCQRLRRQAAGTHLTIIALSGYDQEEDRRQSLAAGFDAHLVKPVDLGVLKQML